MTKRPLLLAIGWILGLATAVSGASEGPRRPGAGVDLRGLQAFWKALYGESASSESASSPLYAAGLLAKARPDECYYGLGEDNAYPFDFDTEACDFGKPKVNESYVFGLTRAGRDLWFGTGPNMGCLVFGSIAEQGIPGGLIPFDTALWTCEYGAGKYGAALGLPDYARDWRPASIYVYDTIKDELLDVTPADPRLEQTLGLRSAGSTGSIVFLAGPTVTGVAGVGTAINLFAFRADTREYLGSTTFPEYTNIRKWIEVDGILYTGARVNLDISPSGPAGAVLRWTGNLDIPFSFERVGGVDGDAAELTEHEGRLFVSTWPIFSDLQEEDYGYAGVWMSPPIGPRGLQTCDRDRWKKVWSADDYERDEVTARLYNGGALASFEGYLYWGTVHAPLSAGFAHALVYDLLGEGADPLGFVTALLGSHRPISVFRGKDFGTGREVQEVLYGLEAMPAYVENTSPGEPERIWTVLPNKMGRPLYGTAGLGNCFNTYTWTMAVHRDDLFVGTMDWSHMFTAVMLPMILRDVVNPLPEFEIPGTTHGADLYVFSSSDGPALELDRTGMRNYGSYGIRTMVSTDGALFLGMANSMNLMTDPNDERPEGGWELIRLERAQCPGSSAPGDFTGDGRVGWADRREFFGCYTGSCTEAPCHLALYEKACCSVADFDRDGDIDLSDWAVFRRLLRP